MTKIKTADQIKAEIAALQKQLDAIEKDETEKKLMGAHAKIAALVLDAEDSLREATKIADEFGINFSWDGPSYGMGGWYDSGEWNSSSANC